MSILGFTILETESFGILANESWSNEQASAACLTSLIGENGPVSGCSRHELAQPSRQTIPFLALRASCQGSQDLSSARKFLQDPLQVLSRKLFMCSSENFVLSQHYVSGLQTVNTTRLIGFSYSFMRESSASNGSFSILKGKVTSDTGS